MAIYKGKIVRVETSPEAVAARFSDLSTLEGMLEKLPEEQRKSIGQVSFETAAIVVNNPKVGNVRMEVAECTPERIVLSAGGRWPMSINVELKGVDDNVATELETAIDINIPVMLRPLVAPHLQQAADQFGLLIARLASVDAQ